jgi:hypothetical protein
MTPALGLPYATRAGGNHAAPRGSPPLAEDQHRGARAGAREPPTERRGWPRLAAALPHAGTLACARGRPRLPRGAAPLATSRAAGGRAQVCAGASPPGTRGRL